MEEDIKELVVKCRNGSFNKSNYCVNLDAARIVDAMLLHTWYDELKFNKSNGYKSGRGADDKKFNKIWIDRVTPEFQRANNKWNKKMKQKFIENLLKGVKVELMLFRMKEQDDAQIIDGLQRTTAILDFYRGLVKPFGYSYSELKDYLGSFPSHNLLIKIYTFNTWEEVGRFYIDMNENITHSKKDIQKAKDWFLSAHGIQL